MRIVTPDGKAVTANECQNKELFWTMRGGGPGFGVLVSATIKAFPTPKVSFAVMLANQTTTNDDALFDLLAEFNTHIPEFSDAGLLGYYIYHTKGDFKQIIFMLHVLNRPATDIDAIIKPFTDKFNQKLYKDNLSIGYRVPPMQVPNYNTYANAMFRNDQVKRDALLPSRLVPKSALTPANKPLLKEKLAQAAFPGEAWIVGAMGAGRNASIAHKPEEMSLNPAWRNTYVHIFTMAGFPADEAGKAKAYDFATNTMEQALIDLAPDSGAYLNEANPFTKDPFKTFWGSNYPRLKQIKKKFDPKGVFVCRTCVGSDEWEEKGDKICRK